MLLHNGQLKLTLVYYLSIYYNLRIRIRVYLWELHQSELHSWIWLSQFLLMKCLIDTLDITNWLQVVYINFHRRLPNSKHILSFSKVQINKYKIEYTRKGFTPALLLWQIVIFFFKVPVLPDVQIYPYLYRFPKLWKKVQHFEYNIWILGIIGTRQEQTRRYITHTIIKYTTCLWLCSYQRQDRIRMK